MAAVGGLLGPVMWLMAEIPRLWKLLPGKSRPILAQYGVDRIKQQEEPGRRVCCVQLFISFALDDVWSQFSINRILRCVKRQLKIPHGYVCLFVALFWCFWKDKLNEEVLHMFLG